MLWAISHDPADTNLSEYATGIYLNEGGLSGPRIVFLADSRSCAAPSSTPGDPRAGIYAWDSGSIETIVDTTAIAPSALSPFVAFSNVVIDGENIAFVGHTGTNEPTNRALYLWHDGRIDRVVDSTYTFQGRQIQYFKFGHEGLSGDSLAFVVRFDDDNTEAIYVATLVPEPSSLLLAALGSLFLAIRTRRT